MRRHHFSNDAAVKSQRDRFTYVKLSEAFRRVGEKFNLVAIVKGFKLPRQSIGTDKCISIRLADDSHNDPGILVNFFGRNFEDLPLVMSAGDIIIVSRASMFNHDGTITAEYSKKFSSFALYEGRSGTNFNPYQASSNFDRNPSNSTRTEERLITELRTWLVNFQPVIYNLKLIRDIDDNQLFSFVGKILYKQMFQGRWIIYFWDGSDAPPISIDTRLDDESGNLVKLQLEPEPLPRDVLSTFPRSGTVLRITLGEGDMYMSHDFCRIGKFVNFYNIKCEIKDDLWCAVLLSNTYIRYVQENPPQFQCESCKFGQASFVSQEMIGCCIPQPTEITEVDLVNVPLVSLMDALSCSSVVGRFKCIVRVVAVFPWKIEGFLHPDRVRLTLEDSTARIHAMLYEEDMVYFVNGLLGNNYPWSKLESLAGVDGCGSRNPPWVTFCLKYSQNPHGSREFKIFGTKLRM